MHWKMRLFIKPFAKNSGFHLFSFNFLHFSIQFTMHPTIFFPSSFCAVHFKLQTLIYPSLFQTYTRTRSRRPTTAFTCTRCLTCIQYTRIQRHARTHTATTTIWLFFRAFLWARKHLFHSLKQAKWNWKKERLKWNGIELAKPHNTRYGVPILFLGGETNFKTHRKKPRKKCAALQFSFTHVQTLSTNDESTVWALNMHIETKMMHTFEFDVYIKIEERVYRSR